LEAALTEGDLVLCRDPAAWDAWVAASPQGTVFARSAFLDAIEVDAHRWFVTEGGRPAAAALVLTRRGQVVRAPHPYTMYQGMFLAGWSEAMPLHRRARWQVETVTRLLQGLTRRYDALSFCLHPSITDLRAFQWLNYHDHEQGQFSLSLRYTGILEAGAVLDLPAYLKDLRANRRRDFEKARRAGLLVGPSRDLRALEALYEKTLARQDEAFPETYRRLLRRIGASAIENGYGELLVCRDPDGRPLSASLFLRDASTAYYLFGGNDPEDRDSGSGTFLMIECLRRAAAAGLRFVDFCGVNSPNRGDFKLSFNAAVRPYVEAHWARPFPFAAIAPNGD
jgi:hypothetical protein